MSNVVLIESLPPTWNPWDRLKLFMSEEWVCKKLIEKHAIPRSHHRNAEKQAQQIRYCISQAKEYWGAAQSSTTATRPLQLYYGCVSLALAEVLWKASGNEALDKMRETHHHHGLSFTYGKASLNVDDLRTIIAVPHVVVDRRIGTFELWHTHARESDIFGKIVTRSDKSNHTQSGPVLSAEKDRMALVPLEGYSLQLLYANTPRMLNALSALGLDVETVRATINCLLEGAEAEGLKRVITLVVHPTSADKVARLREQIILPKTDKKIASFEDHANGFVFRLTGNSGALEADEIVKFPQAFCTSVGTCHFKISLPSLNEFGIFYAGSYLLGMLSRYYPDMWMKEIDRHSNFIYLAEAFLAIVMHRAPILSLNALDDAAYLNDTSIGI